MRVAVVDPSSFSLPYDHHLCRGLTNQGCEVCLFCGQRDFYAWEGRKSYSHERLFYSSSENPLLDSIPRRVGKVLKGFDHLKSYATLYRRLASFDPDIVHFQWLPIPVIDRIFIETINQKWGTVYTVHNSTPLHGDVNPLQQIGIYKARGAFDKLLCHTEYTKHNLAKSGISRSKISTIPHGALTYDDLSWERESLVYTAEKLVLFFGSIRKYKNPELAIRSFARVPEEVRNQTELRFVGKPKMDVDKLRRLAKSESVSESVKWDLQYVPDSAIPKLFTAADLVLLPYSEIDQSGVLMTAMGFGTPVVVSDIGGFSETITDGKEGYLCELDDLECFADRITEILRNKNLSDEMGNSMAELAGGRYSWDKIAEETVAVYDSVRQK